MNRDFNLVAFFKANTDATKLVATVDNNRCISVPATF